MTRLVYSILGILLVAPLAAAQAEFNGLAEAASEDVKKWAVVFDFDSDSCYPAPAVSSQGQMSGGLRDAGHLTGECRQLEQFKNANTYCRKASITKEGADYRVYMYALYFEKDQAQAATHFGHRHDWEYALIWTKDGRVTHASFSAHGNLLTLAKEKLHFDENKGDTVKVVYHKDKVATRSFRPADPNEAAENDLGEWVTPALVEWGLMKSGSVSNELLRLKFNGHGFGEANCPFNDRNFRHEISKNPPPGYPGSDEWSKVPLDPSPPPDYSAEPPKPRGLVARWHVLPRRDAGRDNRTVNLRKGQRAKIVVHLPDGVREQIRFNLKHDKRGKFGETDRGRTPVVGHEGVVSGDAHDWPSFGNRIYLGERDGVGHGFDVAPNGFYVDLVLIE